MNMKKAQINLKLFLDALGISPEISTLEDRKRVQKAVYIGQEAGGVDLGYSYGWYLLGPYSPELTQDYFTLNDDLINGDEGYKRYKLVEPLLGKLDNIKSLMEVPQEADLPQEDWLELVASIVYLMKERNDVERTRAKLSQKKGHLMGCFEVAFDLLKEQRLISS
jgi:uncharacterized protein YwgA